ncbi:MAG: AAA domain-containing protein, partial [Bacteroidales bacterium]|nr:AAA domain-containing protein [Bacteroidales bacterium]
MNTNEFITDLLNELEGIAKSDALSLKRQYEGYYRVLVNALNQATRDLTIEFSGPFARLDHLCRQCRFRELHPKGYAALLAFRGRCTHLKQYKDDQLCRYAANDLKALCDFLAALYGVVIPCSLASLLPANYITEERCEKLEQCLRVMVENIDEQGIYVNDERGNLWFLPWQYSVYQRFVDLCYMKRWLHASTQLNLINPFRAQGNIIMAEHAIYEPDYLIDTSAIAGCFKPYGVSAYELLLRRFSPFTLSAATLLGNLAGQMLDEEVRLAYEHPEPISEKEDEVFYDKTKEEFLKRNALQLLTCSDLQLPEQRQKFDQEARLQQRNLRRMVRYTFAQDKTIDLSQVVLEPTFYCEMLGVQGRLDLMQLDKHVLMEQKSGKRDEYRKTHREEHFVQMLVYQAMLHYAYADVYGRNMRNDDIASYLLYSKYEDGLLKESPAPQLLAEALKLRNQLAYLDLYMSRDKLGRNLLEALTPEHFNTRAAHGPIWDVYCRPRIAEVLDTLHGASALEKDYFYRMLRFVAREQVLGKMGNSRKEASGFAALWNCIASEKKEAGNLLDSLVITNISDNGEEITLLISNDENDVLPNFREGDIVVLYSYRRNQDPDARRDLLLRARVKHLLPHELVVRLNAPQHNRKLFRLDNHDLLWAMEHDYMEASNSALYRGLFAFLQAPKDRRDLLLGMRMPRRDEKIGLRCDYGPFNSLVLKARQAQDYFLLVGPPGTGKTSMGLVNILNEHLQDDNVSVLLLSYTNRAVDEIISKLEEQEIGYLHIGHSDEDLCAEELAYRLANSRVIVGTTTAITGQSQLFDLRHFDLCIIDEASQILEPHLLAILSAKNPDGREAVKKFVMIGDHKQLPAVVQQSVEESAVEELSLRAIGLLNCRQSLFERLIRNLDPAFCHTLSSQGRMHNEVAAFANQHFYGSLLTEVPLEHQLRPIPYRITQSHGDSLLRLL